MKLRYKLPLIFILIDLFFYFLAYFIGKYQVQCCSNDLISMRPDDIMFIPLIFWELPHLPIIFLASLIFPKLQTNLFLPLGLIQTGLIFYLDGILRERIKSKKNKIIVK